MSLAPEQILDRLDDEQRAAATALTGPVCILAGAGTGKTRAITHRIAYGVATGAYDPQRVLALTFTNRAAGEMRTRLAQLGASGVQARTFHSAALSQLSYFWPRVAGGRMPQIVDSKARVIADASQQLHLRLDMATLRDVAGEIEWRKARAMTIEDYGVRARTRPTPGRLTPDELVDMHIAYERIKDERRQIDFEDVLLATTGMLAREPIAAENVRAQFRFFVVDEYQDVSPLQQALLTQWLGDRRELCVVGDASQTIYSFAGANPAHLLEFASTWSGAEVIRLERNYRSTPEIVASANRLMRGRAGALELRAASHEQTPEPQVTAYPSDGAEAAAVAAAARRLVDAGQPASSIAILTRYNAQSAMFESALAEAGLSSTVRGAKRFFEQPDVKKALLMLRSSPQRDAPLFQQVTDVLRDIGWRLEAPPTLGAERMRWDSLNAIVTLADEAPDGTTLEAFAADLTRRAATDHEPSVEAVTIATLHSAKGLEWDHVFIIGMAEGLLPISYATTLEAIDEERRLAYVGITRARRSLSLSHARASGRQERQPSRFLAELRSRTTGGAPSGRSAPRR